jgi:hypothetical protein
MDPDDPRSIWPRLPLITPRTLCMFLLPHEHASRLFLCRLHLCFLVYPPHIFRPARTSIPLTPPTLPHLTSRNRNRTLDLGIKSTNPNSSRVSPSIQTQTQTQTQIQTHSPHSPCKHGSVLRLRLQPHLYAPPPTLLPIVQMYLYYAQPLSLWFEFHRRGRTLEPLPPVPVPVRVSQSVMPSSPSPSCLCSLAVT